MQEIGNAIRTARRNAHLTQAELGARLSPPRTHAAVSDIEREKTRPTLPLLRQIARVLGVDYRVFLPDVAAPTLMISGGADWDALAPESRAAMQEILIAGAARLRELDAAAAAREANHTPPAP